MGIRKSSTTFHTGKNLKPSMVRIKLNKNKTPEHGECVSRRDLIAEYNNKLSA